MLDGAAAATAARVQNDTECHQHRNDNRKGLALTDGLHILGGRRWVVLIDGVAAGVAGDWIEGEQSTFIVECSRFGRA